MAFPTALMRENSAIGATSGATHMALYSTAPGASAGTELSGGSYARKAITWTPGATDGTTSCTVTFDVPAGATVAGCGLHDAASGGNFIGGASLTSQSFSTAGTYTVTFNVTVA